MVMERAGGPGGGAACALIFCDWVAGGGADLRAAATVRSFMDSESVNQVPYDGISMHMHPYEAFGILVSVGKIPTAVNMPP